MIHETAVISKNSQIDETTNIGPFCVIGDGVTIGKNNKLISHVSISGYTKIKDNNTFSFGSIGFLNLALFTLINKTDFSSKSFSL